ncbi:MAG TPA: tRNA pseudouridine(55) synthase TruB [Dehalococcoidia bacterium]|jgi:tRNA pseudouridine55 synthase|nr:tRNA pseudouridine(55) synthase TruB [Dehalococcoidia bacterium]
MDGILNINKPAGRTSFSVVALVRRLSQERRVGHAGTLDPMATGVLPVCLGQGTRVIEFLADSPKTYRAQIELGVATDTYDASGKVIQQGDPSHITREQVELALGSFRGLIQQTPPMYSALKHQGQRLYELARAGISVERKSRPAKIHHLEVIDWQPPVVTVEVTCGKGTYIRSLAHDLGQLLGCGATLKSLVRLNYGPFDIETAISLPQLEDAFHYGYWPSLLHPIDSVLLHWGAAVVSQATEQSIRRGAPVALTGDSRDPPSTTPTAETYCRTYTFDGHFLGVLRFDPEKGYWRPEKVFFPQSQ